MELNRDGLEQHIAEKVLLNYSSDLIDIFEMENISESNNLTESVIKSLQEFLMHHKGIATIELIIGTSKEQIEALLQGIRGIMEIQGIDLIDHQNGYLTIETDISDSPLEVEVLGDTLRRLIGIDGVQVNVISNLYSIKHTFEDIQAIDEMIL